MGSRRVRFASIAIAALVATTVSAAPAQALPVHPGPSYYLSLGDSLAYGYQPNLVAAGAPPSAYRSYAEDFSSWIRSLALVNYGCPGETTTSLINGPCPWPQTGLHTPYAPATTQLGAAEVFLTAHGAQTKLVTLDIGSNDLLALVGACEAHPIPSLLGCLEGGLTATVGAIETNDYQILATVRALAPSARIVMFNLYNPIAIELPGSDTLIAAVNQALAGFLAGSASSLDVHLADAFGAINGVAGSTLEQARICLLTWMCSSYANIHPTTLGYWSLTFALIKALA